MAEVSSSLSLLPWIWAIETLASEKEVDASLIRDVIETAPQLPDDLGENMKEMVALRCLVGLYGSADGSTSKVSLVLDSSIRFDPSESCESALRFIFDKTPSNPRVPGDEQLKLDIHSFIMHKRASMPKCTLQQLKDSILDGTHECVATLKDISGLACNNECEAIPSDYDHHNAALSHMHTTTQSNGENRNSVSQTIEDGHKLLEEIPLNLNPSPSSRDRFELGAEKVVGDITESEYASKSKKRKHLDSSAITSEDETHQNITGSGIENSSTCPADPQTLSAAPQEGIDHEIHEFSSTPKHGSQMKTPNNASHDESREKVITNESNDNMGDCHEAEKLTDCGRYGNEKIDVNLMKNQFLSSQFTLHDSDWTERNFCVKCSEGGQLLVCNAHGCYMVVHEDCLGFSARLDNEGNFCCPFCTYSAAISEYLESKKRASLAKKRLASFISPNFEHRSNRLTEELHTKEGNPRQGEDVDLEVVRNGHLGETVGNRASGAGDHRNEVNDNRVQPHCNDVNLPCTEEGNVNSRACNVSSKELEGGDVMDQDCSDVRGTGKENQVPPTDQSCDNSKLPCENREDVVDQGCPDVRTREEDQVPPAGHICVNGKLPCENREAVHVNSRHIQRRGMQKEIFDFDSKNGILVTSNDSNKRRRQTIDYMYPTFPQPRRNVPPFTAEEEEIIKVGVSRFSNGNEKGIPWKAILEFGANVFLKGRKPGDLKNKWRTLGEGSHKPK